MTVIIAGAGGGALFVAIIITVVVCRCMKKGKGDRSQAYELNDTKDISKSGMDIS
jgi:hypothetical protein